MSELINFNDTEPQVLVPRRANPSPYILTNDWTDLPEEFLLNVQGSSTIALWVVFADLVSCSIRVLGTDSTQETHFYSLPIHTAFRELVEIRPQEFQIQPGAEKIIISLPLSGVVNYCKIQVKGDAKIIRAVATLKGSTM